MITLWRSSPGLYLGNVMPDVFRNQAAKWRDSAIAPAEMTPKPIMTERGVPSWPAMKTTSDQMSTASVMLPTMRVWPRDPR
jgi:hypothetical protein